MAGVESAHWEWRDLSSEVRKIFMASLKGDVETLRLLLSDTSIVGLLLQRDRNGKTALHWALNKDTAQVLIESVESTKLREFLWVRSRQWTALDIAVLANRADVVEYLCGLASADESLLDGHLLLGNTPLHLTKSAHIAGILVESVPSDKLTTLLLHTDDYQQTALHQAVSMGHDEVVEYLCSLSMPQLLLHRNARGNTALHEAITMKSIQLLVESLPESMRRDFVSMMNKDSQTALHAAARLCCDDVVKYLCGLATPELLLHQDRRGDTVLHKTRTKKSVELFLELLPDSMRLDFLHMRNDDNDTALHNMVEWEDTEPAAVDYYLNIVPSADDLLYMKDCYGSTALHYVSTGKIANILLHAAQDKLAYINIADEEDRTALHYARTGEIASMLLDVVQDKLAYLNIADHKGNTAAMCMVERGAIDVLQFTLECVEIEEMELTFLITNKNKQNIFHLACISPLVVEFYKVLEEYLDYMNMEDLFTADIFDNTPFTYLVARFCTGIFAQFILKFPLHQRRRLLLQENDMRTSCQSISEQRKFSGEFYVQNVLCNRGNMSHLDLFIDTLNSNMSDTSLEPQQSLVGYIRSPELHYKYDEDLFKVMLYALNVYSLQDLHISIQGQVVAGTCSTQVYHREQTDGRSKKALPPPILLYFDVDENSLHEVQRELYELDVPDGHSGLKVIVVRYSTSDLVRYLSPPGPDFIIITLVSVHSHCDMLLDLQTKSFKDVEDLLGYLKNKKGVKYININSTMGKNYGKPRSRQAEDVMLLSGASKGKAMIICNRTDRENWEIEHEHACRVLGEQLGLQVECLYDKSADDMLAAISEFSKSSGHGSLTAVSIMSHGDLRDNICGDGDGGGICSVQQVVDALCHSDMQSITKMIFFSFCRGEIGGKYKINRTYNSWESTDLKRTAQCFAYNPIGSHLSQEQLKGVRQRHPFPSVDVPLNCYICYSTLPDSKDFRWNTSTKMANKMFDCLSEHLTNIYKYNTLFKSVDSTHALCGISTSEQEAAVSTQPQLPTVELISLLIDVTGIVREKSGFTQYMNLCYTIEKCSKPVVVEILPAKK